MTHNTDTGGPHDSLSAHLGSSPAAATPLATTKLIHDLLKCAGLRAYRVEKARQDGRWIISTVHRTDRGTWESCDAAVDIHQLQAAATDSRARRKLIHKLARALGPRIDSAA